MLIDSLQDPALYDHPVEKFEVIETHISWVLLTGPYAYKIKKPVNLGFLDFSTREARKFYCEEEVRLNRRHAPDLYLGVIAITGTVNRPLVNGLGEPIEFAVKMIQFPEDRRLDRLLEQGRLHPSHIDDLACRMVTWHRQAAVAGPESSFGTPEGVFQPIQETCNHLQKLVTDREFWKKISNLSSWFRRERDRLEDDFRARKRENFIRECHGDAHLANMVFFNGRVVLFDCIEFNEGLRWIDVMSDVAFTVMDLEDREAAVFARRFLNATLEGSGDYEGLRILAFYKAYRALVRAKVAVIRKSQERLSKVERRSCEEEAARYVALASSYARPARPALSITHGLSGSGKTFRTQDVLESSGAVRIRTDVERKRLFGLRPEERTPPERKPEIYGLEANRRVYDRLEALTRFLIGAGYSVIADGTFLKRDERMRFRKIAEELKAPFEILDFPAPEATLRERVARRMKEGGDASEADLSVLDLQLRVQEPLGEDERITCVKGGRKAGSSK